MTHWDTIRMSDDVAWSVWQAAGNQALAFEAAVLGAFALLIVLEAGYGRLTGKTLYHAGETLLNGAMYAGFFLINMVWAYFIFLAYRAAHEYRLADLAGMIGSPGNGLLLWILDDLVFYGFHRASHRVRFLWAAHITHHSSTRFNLSAAFRQSWFPFYALPFWIVLPWLGFDPLMVMGATLANLFIQAAFHTQLVPRLGPLEWIFNTPSHHRVHHGANAPYRDRNFGGVLIIWDRLFGTFQAEHAEIPVRYGLVENITSLNPLTHAFGEFVAWGKDLWRARSLREILGQTFAPPGWGKQHR